MKKLMLLTAVMTVGSVYGSQTSTFYTSTSSREGLYKIFLNTIGLTTPAKKLYAKSFSRHILSNEIVGNDKNRDNRDTAIKDSIRGFGLLTADTCHYNFNDKNIKFSLYNPNTMRNFAACMAGVATLSGVAYCSWKLFNWPEAQAVATKSSELIYQLAAKNAVESTLFTAFFIGLPSALFTGYKINEYFKAEDREAVRQDILL